MNFQQYENQILAWRAQKEADLRQENGWLALAGLFWLKEGENRIGSDPSCEILLPPRLPQNVGVLEFRPGVLRLRVAEGIRVEINGQRVQEADLRSDREAQPSFVRLDDLQLLVIERNRGFAVRLWDNQHEERRIFPGRRWFPINPRFRIPARYTRYPQPLTVTSPDTFGDLLEETMDGYLTFEFEGQTHRLDVTEMKDGRLYLRFRDLTSGRETYPPTRYCYTQDAVKDGEVLLDFNYAYNPPCAFTNYATCVYAPPQNFLNVRVEAGEMYLGAE